MNKTIVCKNSFLYVMFVLLFILGVISLVLPGLVIYSGTTVGVIIFLVIEAIMLFSISLYSFVWASATILIDDTGIRAASVVSKSNYFTAWEELNYAYYEKNYKNARFWIISQGPVERKGLNRLWLFTPDFGYKKKIYAIALASVKEQDELKKILEARIPHLEYTCEYPKYY